MAREREATPFRAMPAAENIVTRCNGFTAGCSFHKMKTAEAAFKTFSFVPKNLIYRSFADAKLQANRRPD